MTPHLLSLLAGRGGMPSLVAKKGFSDSVSSFEVGARINGASTSYARELVMNGLAEYRYEAGSDPESPFVIKGASGLGDSIYLRVVVEYILPRTARPVEVLSYFAGLFSDLKVKVSPYSKERKYDVRAHYGHGKRNPETNQWQDVRKGAGITDQVPFSTQWTIRNQALVDRVRHEAAGRKVVLVHGGRLPMGEALPLSFRRHQMEVLPDASAFRSAADEAARRCLTVAIGAGDKLYEFSRGMDLWGKTTPEDLMDLGASCDAALGQCSWIVPLAEVFDKPLMTIWPSAALRSHHYFIRTITPGKVLCKRTSRHIMDSENADGAEEKIRAFLDA